MSLKVVRPEIFTAKAPDDAVRLKNRIRGVLRQTIMGLMKSPPPKDAKDASRYHAEISDIWAECHVEAFDINFEELVRSETLKDYLRQIIREVLKERETL